MASKTTPANDPAAMLAMLEALANQQGLTLGPAILNDPEVVAPSRKVIKRTNGKPASARVAKDRAKSPTKSPTKRASAKTRVCNVTAGEAWSALGADPEFEPGDLSKPASGPMLWRLNANGMLADLLS